MRNEKTLKLIYAVASFLGVVFIIVSVVTMELIMRFPPLRYEYPRLAFNLDRTATIVVAVLTFIKIVLHRNVPIQFSKIINIVVVAIFVIGIILFYKDVVTFTFIYIFPVAVLFFCLQLCALVYDFFIRKDKVG